MLAQPDVGAPRMTRDATPPIARDFVDHFLRGQADVGEIEARGHLVGDAEHQHVAVIGLDLRGLQHQDAEVVFERAVVGVAIELAMLGQDDTVERAFGAGAA